jgi:PAS domain S-box-containing protein
MLGEIFSNPGFMPHIHCYLDRQPLVWTMLISDLLIGIAYVGISVTLWALVRRIKISFSIIILCFGVFIGACGTTHFMEVWTLWNPNYWVAAFIKVITAVASVGTAIYLYRLRHQFVDLAEAAKSAESHRLNLEALTRELESRVAERTRQLTESEQRYDHSMRAANVGIWEWDVQSDDVIWNGQNSELYDLDLAPTVKQSLSMILDKVHIEDRGRVKSALNVAVTERQEARTEFRVLTRDGTPRWLMAVGRAEYDEAGKPTRMFGVNTDITQRKLSEQRQAEVQQRLKESEEDFKLVANSISQLAWMTDASGDIIWYNQRWYDFTGTTLQEMQDGGWPKVQHPEHLERVTQKWLIHLKSGEEWEDTFPLKAKNGQFFWFLSRAHAVKDQDGKITRWFGTNTDITELRAALEARDTFLSIASHELKTPLTSLHMATQLRQRELKRNFPEAFTQEKAAKFLSAQEAYVRRLNKIVDDLLDVSRITEDRFHISPDSFDLGEMVLEVRDRFKLTSEASAIELNVEVSDRLIGYWDRFRLEQVIVNLLTNAIRYGLGKPVQLSVLLENSKAVILVKDSGMGISLENQARIFGRYERAVSENEVSGLGLGLYISYEIVKAHRGVIRVTSEVGKGSEFRVILPIEAGANV